MISMPRLLRSMTTRCVFAWVGGCMGVGGCGLHVGVCGFLFLGVLWWVFCLWVFCLCVLWWVWVFCGGYMHYHNHTTPLYVNTYSHIFLHATQTQHNTSPPPLNGTTAPLTSTQRTFFSEIISTISDIKFSQCGRYMLSRDYMTVKLWDIHMDDKPVNTFNVQEPLRSKVYECVCACCNCVRVIVCTIIMSLCVQSSFHCVYNHVCGIASHVPDQAMAIHNVLSRPQPSSPATHAPSHVPSPPTKPTQYTHTHTHTPTQYTHTYPPTHPFPHPSTHPPPHLPYSCVICMKTTASLTNSTVVLAVTAMHLPLVAIVISSRCLHSSLRVRCCWSLIEIH